MNFSIVLASRGRVGLLRNLLQSIQRTTSDISKVEVLIGVDTDDKPTMDSVCHVQNDHPFCHIYPRVRSRNINNDYLNWMYQWTSGTYIIALNDDAQFMTQNWDTIILNKLTAYLNNKPDRIAYGYLSDGLNEKYGMGYCCFPLVTRTGCEALGYVLPPIFNGWNADVACWRVYDAVNRVCNISEVKIDHISYHTGTRPKDEINHWMKQISEECPIGRNYDITQDVAKLLAKVQDPKIATNTKLSLLVPTRERPHYLHGLLDSLRRNTRFLNDVEILVAYDIDDHATKTWLNKYHPQYSDIASFFPRARSNMINRDYYNWLFERSVGGYVMVCHDDCIFNGNWWDETVRNKLALHFSEHPDGIVLGKPMDSCMLEHTNFPIVSRAAVNKLGFLMEPSLPGYRADMLLNRIFTTANRVINLSSVFIDHNTYHNNGRPKDGVNDHMGMISGNSPYDPCICDVSPYVARLLG